MKLEEFDCAKVRTLLQTALVQLGKEPSLFSLKINERTLTQRLSLHLQLLVGDDLSVDCEYNRMWEDDEDIVKRLPWDAEQVLTDDDTGRTVYPDVIIHVRGKKFANLLVIEAKRNWGGKELPDIDKRKLEGFTDPDGDFRYPCGAFVNFKTRNKKKRVIIIWFSGGKTTDVQDVIPIPSQIGGAV